MHLADSTGHDVLISLLKLPQKGIRQSKRGLVFRRLRNDLSSLPGVLQVAANTHPPSLRGNLPRF